PLSMLCAHRRGPMLQDWRVDLARIDIANADVVFFFLRTQADPQRGEAKLCGVVRRATQRSGPLSRSRIDKYDHAIAALGDLREDSRSAIKRTVKVACDHRAPRFRCEFAEHALFDVHARVVYQDVDASELSLDGVDKRLDLSRHSDIARLREQSLGAVEAR